MVKNMDSKKISRFISTLMAVLLLMPMNVFAENTNKSIEAYEQEYELQINSDEIEVDENKVVKLENENVIEKGKITDVEDEKVINSFSNDIFESEKENRLNYIYIDSIKIANDDIQNIVVSWGDGSEDICDMELVLSNDIGQKNVLTLTSNVKDLYKFSKSAKDLEGNEFTVDSIKINDHGIIQEYGMDNMEKKPVFYVENERAVQIEQYNSESEESKVEVKLDDEEQISENIACAIMPYNVSTFANTPSGKGDIIIVIDPGHDDVSPGAQYYGTGEEKLVLKIAKYCKEELEKYSGVQVYLTREDGKCPANLPYGNHGGSNEGTCLQRRVDIAKEKHADILISFHLNAATESAKGAEIYYPNKSWKPELSDEGYRVSNKILEELEDIGIKNRGEKTWNSSNGSLYPNGEIEDYLAICRRSKYAGIPGILIEHCFMTNKGEFEKYLGSEEGLKKLGIADAKGIAKAYGLVKLDDRYKFTTDDNGNYYLYIDGVLAKGQKQIGNNFYHFDEATGVMTIGWKDLVGKRVYYQENGMMAYGIHIIDGVEYYFNTITGALEKSTVLKQGWEQENGRMVHYKDGKRAEGQREINGKYYYFEKETGYMHIGWQELPGKKVYYKNDDGTMAYGSYVIDGVEYYFNTITGALESSTVLKQGWEEENGRMVHYKDGKRAEGQREINGKYYYFEKGTGYMHKGWQELPGKTVYYKQDGTMAYGRQIIDGKICYFNTITGALEKVSENKEGWKEENGYKVYYKNGLKVHGQCEIAGKYYYFERETGYMHVGWQELPGKTVYYKQDGTMSYGRHVIDGVEYYFNTITGALETSNVLKQGWEEENGRMVHYKDGKRAEGQREINGKYYYFEKGTGYMHKGWQDLPGKQVYYKQDGTMAYGSHVIDGVEYYFNTITGALEKSNVLKQGWEEENGQMVHYKDGKRAEGQREINGKYYYFEKGTGYMHKGWQDLPGKKVYYKQDGTMMYGEAKIDGNEYYFDIITGAMFVDGWHDIYYYGKDGIKTSKTFMLIEGESDYTSEMFAADFKKLGKEYPENELAKGGAPTIEIFCDILYDEAKIENIKPEIVYAQMIHETGALQFTGDVSIEQFNFAGLGATGGVPGNSYPDVRTGLRAQIQHLKAYGSKEELVNECVDNRYMYVEKGSAIYLEWLGIPDNPNNKGWANQKGYGFLIRNIIENIKKI